MTTTIKTTRLTSSTTVCRFDKELGGQLETMTNISISGFRLYILASSLSEHILRIPEGCDAVVGLD